MRNPSRQMLLAGVLSALPCTTVFADEPHACDSDKGTTTIRLDLGRKINVSCEAPVGNLRLSGLDHRFLEHTRRHGGVKEGLALPGAL